MAQAASNVIEFPRRSLLVGGAAALISHQTGAAQIPPRPPVDPIFRAIAEHEQAERHLEATLGDINFDQDRAQWRRMRRPVDLACVNLIGTVPTTPGGVAALLWYVGENQRIDNSLGCEPVARLLRRRAHAAFAGAGST